jgi:hypothetical protein
MTKPTLMLALTAANAAMFVMSFVETQHVRAQSVPPVLRGRALEIVDQSGRIRAELKVFPPDPTVKMPDGSVGYPETVLLRLITSKGAPNVKIATTEHGSGISLGGERNPTHIQILARGTTTSLKLKNSETEEQVIKP